MPNTAEVKERVQGGLVVAIERNGRYGRFTAAIALNKPRAFRFLALENYTFATCVTRSKKLYGSIATVGSVLLFNEFTEDRRHEADRQQCMSNLVREYRDFCRE